MRAALGAVVAIILSCSHAWAETSEPFSSPAVTARLITAQNGVAPGNTSLTVGLQLELGEGWKTYWRSPGEVGLPPEIDWSGSTNIVDVEMQYPAPDRFSAFGIENFGYSDEVVFPFQMRLGEADSPVMLEAKVNILVCADICLPASFELSLALPMGARIDADAAELISKYASAVPGDGQEIGLIIDTVHLDDRLTALTISVSSAVPFEAPDIFPELGEYTSFGRPDIRISGDRLTMWAQVPILGTSEPRSDLMLTVTDGTRAATVAPTLSLIAPEPPYRSDREPGSSILWMLFLALIGGLILNLMPCVLPVLSIKLNTAIKYREHSAVRIRNGFLVSALGVLAFMWALAAILVTLRSMGVTIGWGLQFQSPMFLVVLLVILTMFIANLAGFFEIALPVGLQSRLARADGSPGYGGDFATGAFAALLATPCSAPILGSAIAFAFAGSPAVIFLIFSGLGVGLAFPYLVVAARPGLINNLPRPGRWMIWLKTVLAFLLGGTSIWLLWILYGVSGTLLTSYVTGGLAVLMITLASRDGLGRTPNWLVFTAAMVILALPTLTPSQTAPINTVPSIWTPFERGEIAQLVSRGQVVLVDVTADWCLTCKANKAIVLDRDPVAGLLMQDGITPMQADWTRSDESISRYLQSFDRYGIPFNIVYGPAAPEGIVLPEFLTVDAVTEALSQAAD